ncbi:MAG: hypothetical protein AAGJ38_02680 [Planctomycetota bacterium]
MSNFQIIDPPGNPGSPGSVPTLPSAVSGEPRLPLPLPRVDFDVRPGTLDDLPWVDAAQKAEREGLGFRFQSELEGHVRDRRLHIAEDAKGERVAYCIARDRYQSRDELGLIVQMYVVPEHRRSLVAANFLSRIWDTWPTGVKLCSCWCAQDLPANRFWESCGFRALAFRTGSRETRFSVYDADGNPTGKTKGHRIHIYWQKRIRGANDETPYWYPGQTGGGSLNEARLVFPIPPGTSWRDAKPAVLPGVGEMFETLRAQREEVERKALLQLAAPQDEKPTRKTKAERAADAAAKAALEAQKDAQRKAREAASDAARATAGRGGLRFTPLPPNRTQIAAAEAERLAAEAEAGKRERAADTEAKKARKLEAKRLAKAAVKKLNAQNDPQLKAMARELRDRWMDAVAADAGVLSLPSDATVAGYDVSRQVADQTVGDGVKRVENASEVKRLAA